MGHSVPAVRRCLSGTIAYRAAGGEEVGRETFDIASHAGGHVLRAMCLLDDVGLMRDITLSMAPDWTPREGYCRLTRSGEDDLALWFRASADSVTLDAMIGGRAVAQQVVDTAAPIAYLGLHPLQGDALIVEQRGTASPGSFWLVDTVTNSISPNGDEAVGAHRMTIAVAYVGPEQVSVAAGSFAARRYALRWREDWPVADLWVRAEDNLFLLMRWSMIPTWYELIEWRERVG